jgi:hypothetical protein
MWSYENCDLSWINKAEKLNLPVTFRESLRIEFYENQPRSSWVYKVTDRPTDMASIRGDPPYIAKCA